MPSPAKSPRDVEGIRKTLATVLSQPDDTGQTPGNAKWGAYCFYDYDGEPIYVGQTSEQLRVRVRRHLTNQRTDAVAMNVLDPFEVCDVEMWPLWQYEDVNSRSRDYAIAVEHLNALEWTVFDHVLTRSRFHAVLNEKDVAPRAKVDLPTSLRARIIPDDVYEERRHIDTRIARRASTIAALAKVISEREVKAGLRRTLVTQARRLEFLANERFVELGGDRSVETESPDEETGDETD